MHGRVTKAAVQYHIDLQAVGVFEFFADYNNY